MTVVIATAEDIPAIVEMARLAHAESRYRDWPFSEDKVRKTLEIAIASPDHEVIKSLRGLEIAGFFVWGLTSMEFSDQPIGIEISFWVRQQSRGSRCAFAMISAFLAWCEKRQVPAFITPHFAEDNRATYGLMEKMGLKELGRIYARGI